MTKKAYTWLLIVVSLVLLAVGIVGAMVAGHAPWFAYVLLTGMGTLLTSILLMGAAR